ncbi:hypothetical protein BMS3Bbin02_00607 [bacterium BMS3Bbin02]|nr:hypothetical protein BMS3Bbin02_00607 [bacterium BMS3Bbin02]
MNTTLELERTQNTVIVQKEWPLRLTRGVCCEVVINRGDRLYRIAGHAVEWVYRRVAPKVIITDDVQRSIRAVHGVPP